MQVLAGRFQIGERIGAGAMGVVYRGMDCQTQQPIAIKQLKHEVFTQKPEVLERFIHEGMALRQLNHPNIVKMLDTYQENGDHFIVMELVEGGSLADLLSRKEKLPSKQVISLALELSDALSRAHHLRIIHRDLKPGNVLLAADGTPRLTDFGVAHVSGANITETGALIGTLAYMSPESFADAPIDSRTDIWSFGIMLFEMLTGTNPFYGSTTFSTMNAIMYDPLPDLEALCPDAPLALVDLVCRMLIKNPAERISSMRLIGAELEALSQGKAFISRKSAEPTPLPTTNPVIRKHNLPVQTTPFVGREEELRQLTVMMQDPRVRLVTIVAPGGMGKTRLSLEVAESCITDSLSAISTTSKMRFPDGIFFVPLAPLSDPGNIIMVLASALSYPIQADERSPEQQLIDYLRNKEMLLVMDNFEHLVAGAGIVSNILQAARGVKVLATSREKLNLSLEQIFILNGMDFPEWETPADALEYSAVKLFMQSAKRVLPGFDLQAADLRYVARICRLVEGLPLGILLAAAWIETLSLSEIAEEIEAGLDFLETEQRDIPERHRSIRAVFDYSWNLLSDTEKQVFSRLSVFRNGMTRQAAQAVTGASLRDLSGLVNKSLLRRNADSGRYEIHELLRQYSEAHLNENPEIVRQTCQQHCAYYAGALKLREREVMSPAQTDILDNMQNDLMNVRLAWEWAVQHHDFEALGHMLQTLYMYFFTRSSREGYELYRWTIDQLEPIAQTPQQRAILGKVMGRYGDCVYTSANHVEAVEWLNKALEIAREMQDHWEMCFMLCQLTFVHNFLGSRDTAAITGDEALQIAHQMNNPERIAHACYVGGFLRLTTGRVNEAVEMLENSIHRYRNQMSTVILASSLSMLALSLEGRGDFQAALNYHQEALAVRRRMNWVSGIAFAQRVIGNNLLTQGKFLEARPHLTESLRIYQDLGQTPMYAPLNASLANSYSLEGDHARAWELILDVFPGMDAQFSQYVKLNLQVLFRFRSEHYDEAIHFCREGIDLATERQLLQWRGTFLAFQAWSYLALQKPEAAYSHLQEALTLWLEHSWQPYIVNALYAAAWWSQVTGQPEQAVRLAAMAKQRFLTAESDQRVDCLLETLQGQLAPAAYEAALREGQQIDLVEGVKDFLRQ